MDALPLDDVAQIVRLLSEACDPNVEMPINERKRMLLTRVMELIGADIWIWNTGVVQVAEEQNDAMATSMIDSGWKDGDEKLRFLSLITDPNRIELLQGGITEAFQAGKPFTMRSEQIVDSRRREEALELWATTGFIDSMVAIYPLGGGAFSGFGFHRRHGKPPFSDRERIIVQVIVEQVDWLHRFGSKVSAGDKVLRLSGRQRQVLMLLLAGDSQRQIAIKMHLSEHTIGDHVKEIYRRFDVNSRGELFAHFVSGGRN
jgi:DNA-binding CsgD family transcriptional regulator